jgi:hypothetical protein
VNTFQRHLFPDFRVLFADASHYWERRRITYNAILAGVIFEWIVATWPQFRPALKWPVLLPILGLAGIANLCYCAAYLVDIPMQLSALSTGWKRRRWILWLLGTIFAIAVTNYWIGDEIYPYIGK